MDDMSPYRILGLEEPRGIASGPPEATRKQLVNNSLAIVSIVGQSVPLTNSLKLRIRVERDYF